MAGTRVKVLYFLKNFYTTFPKQISGYAATTTQYTSA